MNPNKASFVFFMFLFWANTTAAPPNSEASSSKKNFLQRFLFCANTAAAPPNSAVSSAKKAENVDSSVAERMKRLLSSGKSADVHFSVWDGGKKREISAHKLLLSSASDVFETMFRWEAENAKNENDRSPAIEVTDVEPDVFKTMLDYIYADDLSGLNGDNAMAVLNAAKKYLVTGLIKTCLEYLKEYNVFLAFAEAQLIGEEEIACRCLKYIDKNAEALIQSDAFLQIDQQLLSEILDRDQLVIGEEVTIWNAALCWADEQCRRNGMECSAENRRAALGPALFKIRLPRIPKDDFSKHIVPTDVLTNEEMLSVFQYNCHPNCDLPLKYPLLFPTKRRSYGVKIIFKIENVSKFARAAHGSQRVGEPVIIYGLLWNIDARIYNIHGQKWLSCYVVCNGEKNAFGDEKAGPSPPNRAKVLVFRQGIDGKYVWEEMCSDEEDKFGDSARSIPENVYLRRPAAHYQKKKKWGNWRR